MSETAIIARLEDIAALHRSRGAHRDCRVHDDFEPDCWFCQVTVIEDAVAALRAGAEALRGPGSLCQGCAGRGVVGAYEQIDFGVWTGSHVTDQPCPDCGGSGMVAEPEPRA